VAFFILNAFTPSLWAHQVQSSSLNSSICLYCLTLPWNKTLELSLSKRQRGATLKRTMLKEKPIARPYFPNKKERTMLNIYGIR
jgi:hypothetical protein